MSTYAATISPSATSATLNLSPSSTFQARIARIEFSAINSQFLPNGNAAIVSYGVWVYPSATLSSGTTVTPVRMLGTGPTASATVKSGGTVTGTGFLLHTETNSVTGGVDAANNALLVSAQLNSNYTPAFELIVANGSIFQVFASSNYAAVLNAVVYFEEIRTPRTL